MFAADLTSRQHFQDKYIMKCFLDKKCLWMVPVNKNGRVHHIINYS